MRIRNTCSFLLLVSHPGSAHHLLISVHPARSFGAAFTSFYRLVGPFRSDAAPRVIKTEIWDTITRRGVIGNVLMGILPMSFYATLNLMAWVLENLLHLVGGGVIYS